MPPMPKPSGDSSLVQQPASAGSIIASRMRPWLTRAWVVVVSSVVASRGSPGLAVYAATKAGLEGFARSLARELGPRGIRVNTVAPGFLETDLSSSLSEANRARIVRRTPLGRLGVPADVVGAIEFLTGPRSAFVTGQVVTVDGGSAA